MRKEKDRKNPSKKLNKLDVLKYRGYCRSITAPGEDLNFFDLVDFAKDYLCRKTRTLWKDPIWKEYTSEEVLIEYFSYLFLENEEFKREFEIKIEAYSSDQEDIYDWLDEQVEKNKEDLDSMQSEMADKVSFTPMGEDVED